MGNAQWRRLNFIESNQKLKLDFLIDKNNENRNKIAILEFETLQLADSGDYECLAKNSYGESSAIVQINILRKLLLKIFIFILKVNSVE